MVVADAVEIYGRSQQLLHFITIGLASCLISIPAILFVWMSLSSSMPWGKLGVIPYHQGDYPCYLPVHLGI